VLTKNNLAKRGWTGDSNCEFCCGDKESLNHLFIDFPLAKLN
jgi:hypothetical protein